VTVISWTSLAAAILLTVSLAGCTTVSSRELRPAKSSYGCMQSVVRDKLPANLPEKDAHCVATALIARYCSVTEAYLAGAGKELRDLLGAGDAQWSDWQADRAGVECAKEAADDTDSPAAVRVAVTEHGRCEAVQRACPRTCCRESTLRSAVLDEPAALGSWPAEAHRASIVFMSTPEIEIPRHRLTVYDYYRMAELGILAPDARVELIEGEIIDMPPQGSRHADLITTLTRRIVLAVGEAAVVRCQLPVRLSIRSEPEPDFAIVKARGSHYAAAHPTADDVLLLVEVAHSSLTYDRHVKIPLYARHGVAEVWLLEIEAGRVHVFRAPCEGNYSDVSSVDRPEALTPIGLPDLAICLSGLFSVVSG
jgi:Uma2 family endonuclease